MWNYCSKLNCFIPGVSPGMLKRLHRPQPKPLSGGEGFKNSVNNIQAVVSVVTNNNWRHRTFDQLYRLLTQNFSGTMGCSCMWNYCNRLN